MSSPRQSPRSAGADDEPIYEPWLDDDAPPPLREAARPARRSLLESYNLTEFFGPNGALAAQLYGYETRPSQIEMAEAVKRAILGGQHALIEAPTGTGKSIAYLAPAILSGQTVVVSTANKSLQSQLFQKDLPFLRQVLGMEAPAVVVKGRSNFVCTLKWHKELQEQRYIELYDRADNQVTQMRRWLEETETGDVDELPFMLGGDLRPRIVSFPDDCLHTDCIYHDDDCWVNRMRDAAAEAQVLVTNHHLLLNALELGFAGQRILPPASLYVIDEAHHLEQIATSVYETVVSDFVVEQLLQRAVLKEHVDEHELDQIRHMNALAFRAISDASRDSSFKIDGDVEAVLNLGARLGKLGQELKQKHPYKSAVEQAAQENKRPDNDLAEKFRYYELTMELVNSTANKLQRIGSSRHDDAFVRYAVRASERRSVTLEVHAAPINPADLLARYLFHPVDENDKEIKRTVICTSATLARGRRFRSLPRPLRHPLCGRRTHPAAVFDYPQNRRCSISRRCPPTISQCRGVQLLRRRRRRNRTAAGGEPRAGALSLHQLERPAAGQRPPAGRPTPAWSGRLRAQGDAPRDALLAWFKATPNSVLLATRSFWEGRGHSRRRPEPGDAGQDAFSHARRPAARRAHARYREGGRSSFDEYMAAADDAGAQAGLWPPDPPQQRPRRGGDPRRAADAARATAASTRRDLPPARFSRDFRDVHRFYGRRALASAAEFALNVWADGAEVRAGAVALAVGPSAGRSRRGGLWRGQRVGERCPRRAARGHVGAGRSAHTRRAGGPPRGCLHRRTAL
jgi:ATP-dependent DNA helicase DinG